MNFSKRAKRDIAVTLLIVCAGLFLYHFLFGKAGYFEVDAKREKLYQLQEENLKLRQRNDQLKKSIEEIRTDPEAVERIGVEEHDLARPGDIIIHLPKEDSPDPPQPPASPVTEKKKPPNG